jgi:hypothetical protein
VTTAGAGSSRAPSPADSDSVHRLVRQTARKRRLVHVPPMAAGALPLAYS